jgi:hypothetical protein
MLAEAGRSFSPRASFGMLRRVATTRLASLPGPERKILGRIARGDPHVTKKEEGEIYASA